MRQLKVQDFDNVLNDELLKDFTINWTSALDEESVKLMKKDKTLTEALPLHGVFYTDGGCIPNPGFGGLGIHGYIYHDVEPKKGHGCKGITPTNHGYLENVGDNAHPINILEYVDIAGSVTRQTTNNEAEAKAYLEALKICINLKLRSAHFILDSEYVLNGCMEWLQGWVSNNWIRADGSAPANTDTWKQIDACHKTLDALLCAITYEWTRGHNGNVGNQLADYNASRGVILAQKGTCQIDILRSAREGYWSPDVDRHVLIGETRWYFKMNSGNTHKTSDGKHCYHIGDHGAKDDWFGKKISTSNFAVLHLENPDYALNLVRELQDTVEQYKHNSIVIAKLDAIYKPKVWNDIKNNGHSYLKRRGEYVELYTPDKVQLTKELRLPRLALFAMEDLNILDDILTDLRLSKNEHFYCLTPFTDILYETVIEKNKEVRKFKIDNDQFAVNVDANYNVSNEIKTAPVTLTIGVDTPKRNVLAALAKTDAQLWCVTWKESALAFRYGVLIKTGNDYGLWVGNYSNYCLV